MAELAAPPTSISELTTVLDTKIKEISFLRQLLTTELSALDRRNHAKDKITAILQQLDCARVAQEVRRELEGWREIVVDVFDKVNERYMGVLEKTKLGYQREIYELETELQKQYRLTRSMKAEVEELKGLVDCFVREKQAKIQEEAAGGLNNSKNETERQKQIPPSSPISTPPSSNSIPLIKNPNPILEIITQEDENQSTKRQPEDEIESPHLQMPRISIKEYITLECLQNKLKGGQVQSPKFSCEFSKEILSCELEEASSGGFGMPVLSDVAIERNIPFPKPTTSQTNSGNISPKHKKPARFFLQEFKKSFQKTMSENSIDRKDCGLNVSSNYENMELFSLEESKKFDSSSSTPSNNNNLGKVTFGKEKKFFSEIDESQEQGCDEQTGDQKATPNIPSNTFYRKSFQPQPMRKKSKQPNHPLTQKHLQQQQQQLKNPYLVAKKKLNYNSISSSNSGQQVKDKQRQNSYSSRQKTTVNHNHNHNSREDRYKLLIRNILNIKEKENHGGVVIGGKKGKDGKDGGGSAGGGGGNAVTLGYSLFVGDKKMEIKYEGAKRDGRRHGRGTLFYSNGLSFQGQFRDGLRCGYGILKFNHIEIYNGDWQNDMLNGQGRIKNCSVISKKRREPIANGSPQLHKWISYSGEFRDNKFHGTGTLFLQNGEKFLGKFSHGLAEGEGTFYKNNGEVEFGIWRNNVFSQKF